MRNLLKYTIGLPVLIFITLMVTICFLIKLIGMFIIMLILFLVGLDDFSVLEDDIGTFIPAICALWKSIKQGGN